MLKKSLIITLFTTLLLKAVSWDIKQDGPATGFSYMSNQSLTIESDNKNPHIIFRGDKLYHLYFTTSWQLEQINDDGNYSSVFIDSKDKLYVGYSDESENNIKYATNSSGSWVKKTANANDANYTKIALFNSDPNYIYLLFSSNGKIEYATNRNGFWSDKSSNTTDATDLSMAIDSNENIHIAYYDKSNKDLKYLKTDSSGNFSNTNGDVDTSGDIGEYPSIAIDSKNLPHISYYDATNKDLKYAYFNGTSWNTSTIDWSGDVGKYSSIGIDYNDKVFISYYDATHKILKFATNENGNWEKGTIDFGHEGVGEVGKYTSLKLTPNGYAFISYFDENLTKIRLASKLVSRPKAPIDLNATAITNSSIKLTWTDNSTNEDNFTIYRNGSLIKTLPNNTATYTDNGLNINTLYTYLVKAKNDIGESTPATASSTTLKTPPNAPGDLAYTTLSASSVKLKWKDNSDNEESFVIYKDNSLIKSVNADTNETTIDGLSLNTLYHFKVGAKNNGGENNSSSLDVNLSTALSKAPTNLKLEVLSDTAIKLTWEDNSDDEKGFSIYRKKESGIFSKIATTADNIVTFTNVGLNEDTKYSYIVSSYNTIGENNSSLVYATTLKAPPPAVSNIKFNNITANSMDINWTDNSTNESNFTIFTNGSYSGIVNANITGFHITSLSPDHNYTFTVSANNSGAETNTSANTATLPNPPVNVKATPLSSTQVKITWENNSSTVTSFSIYRNNSLLISGIKPDKTEYTDTDNLSIDHNYSYVVKTVNLGGENGILEANVTVPDSINPPGLLTATAINSTVIKLSWKDNSNNETGFEVFRDGTLIAKTKDNTTVYIDEGLTPNTPYFFEVRAVKPNINSDKVHVTIITPDTVPLTPGTFKGEALDSSSIKLSWSDNSSNEKAFILYRNGTKIATVAENITTFTDRDLLANTTYFYQLKATNDTGDSRTIGVSATTKDTAPNSVGNLMITDITDSSVKLIWSDNSSNEKGFKIYRDNVLIKTMDKDAISYMDSSLSPNTSYNYEIRAYNDVGESSGSSLMVTTKNTIPTAPADLNATALSADSVKLTWSDQSSNEEGFRIYKDNNLIYITAANTESFIDNDLLADHLYTYKVEAANNAGNSQAVTTTFSTNNAPPFAPINLMAIEAGSSSVKLTWNDRSSNEKGFHIYRNSILIKTLPAESITFTDTALGQNTPYSYIVRAFNDYGESEKVSFGITLKGGDGKGTKEDFIKRLYQNFLGREADTEGVEFWKEKLTEGATATEIAKEFFKSEEFKNPKGGVNTNLTNEQYVTMLYITMLNRQPDLEGLLYWVDQMATKGKSREIVFDEFALSSEFYALSQNYGILSHDQDDLLESFLDNMYYLVMGREPDDAGKAWWKQELKNRNKRARDIATGFFDSDEFKRKNYTDYNFITIAYRALLSREADMQGRDFWLKELKKNLSRHDLVMNFISSDEFKSLAVKYGIDY